MARELSSWLAGYLRYVEQTEPDDRFKISCGLWALAGALQRKSWVQHGDYDYYPNLYIILTGPAGAARKTTAINPAFKLLESLNSRVSSHEPPNALICNDKITPEALIKWAAENTLATDTADGSIIRHNSVSLAAGEFATFMGHDNHGLIAVLNNWFDCPAPWENRTIVRGGEVIEATWFNIIGGSTPTYLAGLLPLTVLETGLGSRIMFVYSDTMAKRVGIPRFGGGDPTLVTKLKNDLYHIFKTYQGPVAHSEATEDWYNTWYYDLPRWNTLDDRKLVGYQARKPLHIVKLAHIHHASWSDKQVLEVCDFEWAENFLLSLEAGMSRALGEVSNSAEAVMVERVLGTIQSAGGTMATTQILATHMLDGSPMEVSRLLEGLVTLGRLKKVTFPSRPGIEFLKVVEKKTTPEDGLEIALN
jgi:hypothetical protein